MSSDIARILKALNTIEESSITPASVKKGLNPQQKSVPQLPALFSPKKISPVLGSKKDPKHPMSGYMVGDSVEPTGPALAEAMAEIEEDMLSKVKKDLTHYLDQLANKEKELERKAKKEIQDRNPAKADYQDTHEETVAEDPTEEEPGTDYVPTPDINPTLPESAPIKTITFEDGSSCEIYGDSKKGFEIRRGQRRISSKFKDLDQAVMATDLYRARLAAKQNDDRDYVEER